MPAAKANIKVPIKKDLDLIYYNYEKTSITFPRKGEAAHAPGREEDVDTYNSQARFTAFGEMEKRPGNWGNGVWQSSHNYTGAGREAI
ncbi:MAG: hypothetical protein Kow00111_07600 [Thermincola ferriacetica]